MPANGEMSRLNPGKNLENRIERVLRRCSVLHVSGLKESHAKNRATKVRSRFPK
jgi:hypothetical protein